MFKRDLKTENLEPRILIFKYDDTRDATESRGKSEKNFFFLIFLNRKKCVGRSLSFDAYGNKKKEFFHDRIIIEEKISRYTRHPSRMYNIRGNSIVYRRAVEYRACVHVIVSRWN